MYPKGPTFVSDTKQVGASTVSVLMTSEQPFVDFLVLQESSPSTSPLMHLCHVLLYKIKLALFFCHSFVSLVASCLGHCVIISSLVQDTLLLQWYSMVPRCPRKLRPILNGLVCSRRCCCNCVCVVIVQMAHSLSQLWQELTHILR